MRTIPDLDQHLQPLEEVIYNEFLPSLFGRTINSTIRRLVALPPKLGGMGIVNPVSVASKEFKNSIQLTKPLSEKIINQDRYDIIDQTILKETKKFISKERENEQKKELQEILSMTSLKTEEKKRLEMSLEKGASNWLSALPLREAGFSLNKQEFRDAIALRYCIPILGMPETCVCGKAFTCNHAMICKKGGFITLRHNELRDITQEMLTEVCKNVESEPLLQPLSGEKLKYQTSITENNARLDLSALGFWTKGQRAYFDIRVFDPVAQSHIDQSLEAAHVKQENEKKHQYEDQVINVEQVSFTPLVFTITGGMSRNTRKFFSRLGEMMADSRNQPRSIIQSWMRCRISFSLLRSAILCIRGTRIRRVKPVEIKNSDLGAIALVSRILG